jgi:hypothetical protein
VRRRQVSTTTAGQQQTGWRSHLMRGHLFTAYAPELSRGGPRGPRTLVNENSSQGKKLLVPSRLVEVSR